VFSFISFRSNSNISVVPSINRSNNSNQIKSVAMEKNMGEESDTETDDDPRNPFGYAIGNCCVGRLCQLPTAHLNPERKCIGCDKIMHTLSGHEVDGNGNSICVMCETKES
jgi:hypothetical protein